MPERATQTKNPEVIKTGNVPVVELYPKEKKVRILDVMLDVLPAPKDRMAQRFIPKWDHLKNSTCWDEPTVMLIRDMAIRLNGGISTRNEGPTGVSKSFAAEVICGLTNRNYVRHNYSKDSDPGDTIGRFIPSDTNIATRYEELLAEKDLPQDAKKIIEHAQEQSRPLTLYESIQVGQEIGLSGLDDGKNWRWKNGTLTGSMTYGSVFGADEVNLAPGNVVERENSAVERRPMLRLVEHEGELVRPLTEEEQSVIDDGGVIPGVIGLDQKYWYVAAQNPYGIGGGRYEESEARRNRLQDRIVEALTQKEYEDFLRFLIKGEQPDITWSNKKFRGERNVPTEFREFEKMPNVEVVIKWLAQFQVDLQKFTEKGQIGTEKDIRGGSYVYTRRNLIRFLDSMNSARNTVVDISLLFSKNQLAKNDNWRDAFDEALYQEYLAGLYKQDADIVRDLIKATGIREQLGPSKNNPEPPAWVKKAQDKGIIVEHTGAEWVLSRATIQAHKIDLTQLIDEAKRENYTLREDGDNMAATKPVLSIIEVQGKEKPKAKPRSRKNRED